MLKIFLIGGMVVLAAMPSAAAEIKALPDYIKPPLVRGACRDDAWTYCPYAQQGPGGIKQCLLENRAKTSKDCQYVLDTLKDRETALNNICAAEIERFCPKVEPPLTVPKCLRRNFESLSPICKDELNRKIVIIDKPPDVSPFQQKSSR